MSTNQSEARPFRLAVVQMDPQIGAVERNTRTILERLEQAAVAGAQLIVFPECAVSGYVFESAADALPSTVTAEGLLTGALQEVCRRHNVYTLVGALEQDGDALYNSALIVGPEGLVACYRKCHLPVLGIDRFVAEGDSLPVIDLPFARIGVLICYDVRFPEAARTLTLRGIDLLLVPTNWPAGAESAPEFLTRARAWENRVYLAACNRVGVEREVRFIGRSQIIAPDGTFLAQADPEAETILYAEIDPCKARQKRIVISPGVFELDPVWGRRPALYSDLLSGG